MNVDNFVGNLPLVSDSPRPWGFIKSMFGNGNQVSIQTTSINDRHQQPLLTPDEKVPASQELFEEAAGSPCDITNSFESEINDYVRNTRMDHTLNRPILIRELNFTIGKLKSKAMGPDLNPNDMIRKLSAWNRFSPSPISSIRCILTVSFRRNGNWRSSSLSRNQANHPMLPAHFVQSR